MPDAPPVEVRGLTFAYDGPVVLEDVNLTIRDGEFVCMVGPNGGGKTTLLRLMLGLLRPRRGTVRIFGMPPDAARPRVGYMPQQSHLDPQFPASVLDVARMGRLRSGLSIGPYSPSDTEKTMAALGEVGLGDMAQRAFADLSGGQRQRVLIARALACEPDLLLLDEPTSNVDVAVEEEFFDVLGRLSDRMTIVVVSHDIGVVSTVVESVICVNRQVAVHPTSALNGKLISEIYGNDVRLVRHDHNVSEEGHACSSS